MTDFNVMDYGALGDGATNDAAAIQAAIDAATANGGGRVILPAGKVFYSGGIKLKAYVEFHLERGATLRASENPDDYLVLGEFKSNFNDASGKEAKDVTRVFIHAQEAQDLAITGAGTIDGNARAFILERTEEFCKMDPRRARLIILEKCHRLRVRDIRIYDSANWTLHPVGCDDVVIEGISIENQINVPNCDGIDPDHCRNVRIANCNIVAGDDGIVIKNHYEYADFGPTENITITNCTIKSASAAIKLGTESHADFRNIVVSNCVIDQSNRGLTIQIRDFGNIENVIFQNIVINTQLYSEMWWGKSEPIHLSLAPRRDGDPTGSVKHIRFRNIIANSEAGAVMYAAEGCHVEDVSLEDVQLNIGKKMDHEGGFRDLRPMGGEEHGGIEKSDVPGYWFEGIQDLAIRQSSVNWLEESREEYSHAIRLDRIDGVRIKAFKGESKVADLPTVIRDGEPMTLS